MTLQAFYVITKNVAYSELNITYCRLSKLQIMMLAQLDYQLDLSRTIIIINTIYQIKLIKNDYDYCYYYQFNFLLRMIMIIDSCFVIKNDY